MRENRKFIRLKAPIGVTYKLLKSKRRKEALSLIRNISGGGVCLAVKEPFREGDLLEVRIQIPHLKEPIDAVGEVIWYSVTAEKDRQNREAGIRFRDIAPQDLHQILEYVYMVGIG